MPLTRPSQQSCLAAVLCSFFDAFPIARVIFKVVCIELFEEANDAPTLVSTAKLFGANITDRNPLCTTHYGHALSNTSSAEIAVVRSVNVPEKYSSFFYSYPFQRSEKSEIASTLGNMRTRGYYALSTQAMIRQCTILHPPKNCLRLRVSKGRSLQWQLRLVMVPLRLQPRLCVWNKFYRPLSPRRIAPQGQQNR